MTGPATFSLSSDLSCRSPGEDACSYFHFGPPNWGRRTSAGQQSDRSGPQVASPQLWSFGEAVVSAIRLTVEVWTPSHSGSGP